MNRAAFSQFVPTIPPKYLSKSETSMLWHLLTYPNSQILSPVFIFHCSNQMILKDCIVCNQQMVKNYQIQKQSSVWRSALGFIPINIWELDPESIDCLIAWWQQSHTIFVSINTGCFRDTFFLAIAVIVQAIF